MAFEKESIKTFDSKGELLITIMSSLAQEESRSLSENVKWGLRKRFADGRVSVPFTRFLGYVKGIDGNLVVNPEQAKLVRYIFSLFLQGMSYQGIATRLANEGCRTSTGKVGWTGSAVKYILTNEKYKGDALLQKSYTADFLTKKALVNKGEVPQYYVEKNHEAIISPTVFDLVQKEIANRQVLAKPLKGDHLFSHRIRCAECGAFYGPKTWHSNDQYRKVVWQCNNKHKTKGKPCPSPKFSEDEVKAMFVKAVNMLMSGKDKIIGSFEAIKDSVLDSSDDESKRRSLETERLKIIGGMDRLTAENASTVMDQAVYQERYERLSNRYQEIEARISEVKHAIQDRRYRKTKTELFLKDLRNQEGVVSKFSDHLWYSLADHAEVHGKEDVRFTFKNGMVIMA